MRRELVVLCVALDALVAAQCYAELPEIFLGRWELSEIYSGAWGMYEEIPPADRSQYDIQQGTIRVRSGGSTEIVGLSITDELLYPGVWLVWSSPAGGGATQPFGNCDPVSIRYMYGPELAPVWWDPEFEICTSPPCLFVLSQMCPDSSAYILTPTLSPIPVEERSWASMKARF